MTNDIDPYARFKLFTATVTGTAVGVAAVSAAFHGCPSGNLGKGDVCRLFEERPHIEINAISTGSDAAVRPVLVAITTADRASPQYTFPVRSSS